MEGMCNKEESPLEILINLTFSKFLLAKNLIVRKMFKASQALSIQANLQADCLNS